VKSLFEMLKRALPDEANLETRHLLEQIRSKCATCQTTAGKPLHFRVSAISEDDAELKFNRQVDIDLLWLNSKPVLHVCDHDTRFSAAQFLRGETTLHVWEAFLTSWTLIYHGMPEQILTDQGSVFTSKTWKELLRVNDCKLRLIPIESHNSQGLVESKHNHLRKTFQRVKTDFPGIGDELALLYAVKARNDVANPKGLVPSMLVFGTMPRLFSNETDSEVDSRTATNCERYKAMKSARDEMTKCIAQDKVQTALRSVPPPATTALCEPGQLVLVWRERGGWKGPFLLSRIEGKTAFVHDTAGEPRPFSVTHIKPFVTRDSDIFATNLNRVLKQYCLHDGDVEEGAMEISVTEVVNTHDPRSTSARMTTAKLRELRGLIERGTFKVVLRTELPEKPNVMSTRFVLSIKHDVTGEELYKARLVVRGFQDRFKRYLVHEPNVVYSTSVRMLVALAAIMGFTIWSEDVTQAFVQSSGNLLREVFVEPPKELELDSDLVLKLLKPLYGLSDAGDYWARTLLDHHRKDLHMTPTVTDGSLFFLRLAENLIGMSATYVDDSLRAGTPAFLKIAKATGEKFQSRQPMYEKVKFAGLEIDAEGRSNEVSQKSFIKTLVRLAPSATYEDYRSLRARVAWATQSRPDIACAVGMAAQITKDKFDIDPAHHRRSLNKIIKHLQANPDIVLRYPRMDVKTLSLHVFSDAAFANNDDFVCQLGYLAFLSDQEGNCALLDYKSMKARRVTRSILAGELIAFAEAFDRSFVLKSDLEDMLNTRIPIRMYTDSQSLFDVISKGSMTAERRLQIDIALAREGFDRRWISDIALVASHDNLADALTKPWTSAGLIDVLKTTKLRPHARKWIVR
jgi:hypothetical protein